MSGSSVEIRNFTKRYASLTVVDDISLTVEAGSLVALLGPSGSGKSTVLMGIAGFIQPTHGRVFFGERDVTSVAPRQRNIGMVFQKYALFPHMTVAQNIAFPLIQRGKAKSDIGKQVAEATNLVGLRGMDERPVTMLSGGQQQRVALARALVFRPPILLMDEPLGALDKKMREHLQSEIKEIQQLTDTTVLFVTHDQDEALSMADRLVVLNHGRIEQCGTAEQLYDSPQSAFVADFIGEANTLRGRITEKLQWGGCLVQIADGIFIKGTPANQQQILSGSTVDVIVRPSRIAIKPATEAEPGLIPGELLSSAYLGDSVLARVRIPTGETITAKLPPTGGRPSGHIVSLAWDYTDSTIFPIDRVN